MILIRGSRIEWYLYQRLDVQPRPDDLPDERTKGAALDHNGHITMGKRFQDEYSRDPP
jgi:hypothetical protein